MALIVVVADLIFPSTTFTKSRKTVRAYQEFISNKIGVGKMRIIATIATTRNGTSISLYPAPKNKQAIPIMARTSVPLEK